MADLPERDAPITQEDRDLVCRLESALNQLNRRYDGQFFLFFRGPVYQSSQGTFAGWERKRGALLELARMLRARHSGIEVYSGDQSRLQAVRYLVTLDSDTNPGVGGVRTLVGAMAHPMNRPELDRTKGVVTKGYAIIQPQIRTALSAACATPFARLFAGGAGTDPYRGTGSELCHDLFDEASFCGKGILDIDCFLAVSYTHLYPEYCPTRSAMKMRATGTVCWNFPSTPGLRFGTAGQFPPSCSQVTTPTWPNGAANSPSSGPGTGGRICTPSWI